MVALQLQRWITTNWQLRAGFLQTSKQFLGVTNGYHNPQQLGVDRWLGIIAGYTVIKKPVAIFDCGTFITLDVVDKDGQHLGGMIAPGMSAAAEKLAVIIRSDGYDFSQHTKYQCNNALTFLSKSLAILAGEPVPQQETPVSTPSIELLGHDTQACITSGAKHAALGLIKLTCQNLKAKYGENLAIIITGGDGELLLPELPAAVIYSPNLVLCGLALLES